MEVDTVGLRLLEPCENCVPPYGFRSHMKLMEETEVFAVSSTSQPFSFLY